MRNLGFERGGRDIMSTLKLTLLTDLYEMTMMQGYFKNNKNDRVVFDAFYRSNPSDGGYAICAGLEQVITYIEELRFDNEDIAYLRSLKIFDEDFLAYLRDFRVSGDIYAIPEGTVIFPRAVSYTHLFSFSFPDHVSTWRLTELFAPPERFFPMMGTRSSACGTLAPSAVALATYYCFARVRILRSFVFHRNAVSYEIQKAPAA